MNPLIFILNSLITKKSFDIGGNMKPKVFGVCGSTRVNATDFVLREMLTVLEEKYNCETNFFSVRGKKINPCIHCDRCIKESKMYCPTYEKDNMNDIYEPFMTSDVIILASPVYEMGMTPQMAALLSRFRFNYLHLKDDPFYFGKKIGAAIAVGGTRTGGQETTMTSLHGFFHTNGYIPVGGSIDVYNGASIWSQDKFPFDESVDPVGLDSARKLADRIGYTLSIIKRD